MKNCIGCNGRIWTSENNDSGEFCHSNGECGLDTLPEAAKNTISDLMDRVAALEEKMK